MEHNGSSSSSSSRRKKFNETRHPVYRGVRLRHGSKWVCEVREPGKSSKIWLGTFPTPEMAARAYDAAALTLHGDDASLNFPDSARLIRRARSTSAHDIQEAAYEAAFAFGQECYNGATLMGNGGGNMAAEVAETPFVDEEELFNMPVFYNSMAEGLVITPPDWGGDYDSNVDLSLWNH